MQCDRLFTSVSKVANDEPMLPFALIADNFQLTRELQTMQLGNLADGRGGFYILVPRFGKDPVALEQGLWDVEELGAWQQQRSTVGVGVGVVVFCRLGDAVHRATIPWRVEPRPETKTVFGQNRKTPQKHKNTPPG